MIVKHKILIALCGMMTSFTMLNLTGLSQSSYAEYVQSKNSDFNELSAKSLNLILKNKKDSRKNNEFDEISGDMLSLSLETKNVEDFNLNLNLIALKKTDDNFKHFGEKISNCNIYENLKSLKTEETSNIVAAVFYANELLCKKNLKIVNKSNDDVIILGEQFNSHDPESNINDFMINRIKDNLIVRIYKDEIKNENFLGESTDFNFDSLKNNDYFTKLKSPKGAILTKISEWFSFFKSSFKNEDRLLTPIEGSLNSFKQSWDVVNFAFNHNNDGTLTLNFNILPYENCDENFLHTNKMTKNGKIYENIKQKSHRKSNITMAIFASETGLKQDEKLIYHDELDLINSSNFDNNSTVIGKSLDFETFDGFTQLKSPKSLVVKFYNSEKFDLNNPNQGVLGVFGDKFCSDEKIEIISTADPQDLFCSIRDSYRKNRDNLLIKTNSSYNIDQNYSCDFVFRRKQDGELGLILNLFIFGDGNPNFDKFTKNDVKLNMAILNGENEQLKLLFENKLKPIFCDKENKITIFETEIEPLNLKNLVAKHLGNNCCSNNQLILKFYDNDFVLGNSVSNDGVLNDNMQTQVNKNLEQNLVGTFAGGTHDYTFSIDI